MNDAGDIKRTYRRFADLECKGYSEVYHALALAVSDDDHLASFIAEMPVVQPNLFFASIQLLTGPDGVPRSGTALRRFLKQYGREVGAVAVAPDSDERGRALCRAAARLAVRTAGPRRGRRKRRIVPAPRPVPL